MSEYFSHDYNARNSLLLKKIARQYGLEGIGLYWCIVEILYENNGQIPESNLPDIAYDLRVDESTIKGIIDICDLFDFVDGFIISENVIKQLDIRREKSEKAKQNASKRWENKTSKNAVAMQTHTESNATALQAECDRNAIKGKEIKEKKSKENNNIYIVEIIDYLNQKAGTNYRANARDTVSHIKARLSEGYTVEHFKRVIDKKCADWLNDSKMKEYLRPQTLFGTKFESYLNSTKVKAIDRTDPKSYTGTDDTAAFLATYG